MTVKKAIIALSVLIILGAALYMAEYQDRVDPLEVNLERVGHRKLVSIVSASGRLQAHREVAVSANTMGMIQRLGVREGQRVDAGDFLLMIDPVPFETAIDRIKAVIALENTALQMANAGFEKLRNDLNREKSLPGKGMTSPESVAELEFQALMKQNEVKAAKHRIEQQKVNLRQAKHEYSKVRVHSPISGICTRLNVEEGENVVTGTMNNPGTVLMTISDMSTLEVVLEVDETEVVRLKNGMEAIISFDAYRDRRFNGRVTEISPGPSGGTAGVSRGMAVRYPVTVTVKDEMLEKPPGEPCAEYAGEKRVDDKYDHELRVGLSAAADIIVAVREEALAVPISALTLREFAVDEHDRRIGEHDFNDPETPAHRVPAVDPVTGEEIRREFEGVFIDYEGLARFVELEIGIAGDMYFEVVSGLREGDIVVTGPYQRLRELKEGTPIKGRNAEISGKITAKSDEASRQASRQATACGPENDEIGD